MRLNMKMCGMNMSVTKQFLPFKYFLRHSLSIPKIADVSFETNCKTHEDQFYLLVFHHSFNMKIDFYFCAC